MRQVADNDGNSEVNKLCKRIKRRLAKRKARFMHRARLTSLSPRDDAFNCSKPASDGSRIAAKAPPLRRSDWYYRYLNRALATPNVYNIALAGHFGCGKSTILKTFQKHYAEGRSFLNISLATFGEYKKDTSEVETEKVLSNGDKDDKSDSNELTRLNHLVEHSILQQLFYQVPKRKIPRSRFKRIAKPGRFWPWCLFAIWMFCVICSIAVFKPGVFVNAKFVHSLIPTTLCTADVLLTIGALLAFVIPAAVGFHKLRSVTLRKLNLKNCEIEIAEEKDPSALNKHLDEILYFFEATKFDVVVLEDLDRFQTTQVFTKLREINTLVNRNIEARSRGRLSRLLLYLRIRKRRRVVFIYAIKDDMFTGEERTKFFDLVIPVIPVVNHVNSRELLTQALNGRGVTDISDELINDIALFVSDMRLLHTVVNEYVVYRQRLNMAGLDPQKLFAMILYKNLLPGDFAKLHERSGMLYECMNSKPSLIQKATVTLEQKLKACQTRLARADSTRLKSVRELRMLYIQRIQEEWVSRQWYGTPVLNGTGYAWADLLGDEGFAALRSCTTINSNHGHGRRQWKFDSIESEVDPEASYEKRECSLTDRASASRKGIDAEINELKRKIAALRRSSLQELLQTCGLEALHGDETGVVRLLLRKGYINETFLSYLSYFYEGLLSNSDWVFVQGVKMGQEFDADYSLDNPREIVTHNLDDHEATAQARKNIHVLDYYVKHDRQGLLRAIEQFKSGASEAVDLLTLYLGDERLDRETLTKQLYGNWPEFWYTLKDAESLSSHQERMHVECMICYLSEDELQAVCKATTLQLDISSDDGFVEYVDSLADPDNVIRFLGALTPAFSFLPSISGESPVVKFICSEHLYEVNAHNVSQVYRTCIGDLTDSLPPSLTVLNELDKDLLQMDVEDSLDLYLKALLEIDGAIERESESTVVWILNEERISHELKLMVGDGRCVPIKSIEDVASFEEMWAHLLNQHAVVPTWSAVLAYCRECSDGTLDDVVISYLGDKDIAVALGKQEEILIHSGDDATEAGLMAQILACSKIPTSSVASLLRALPAGCFYADATEVCDSHLPVAYRHITFSVENYDHIRTHAAGEVGQFVKLRLDSFLAKVSELTVTGRDMLSILNAHRHKRRKREIAAAVLAEGLPEGLSHVAGTLCELMFDEPSFAETFDAENLAAIIKSMLDTSTKIRALTQFMNQLTDDGVWDVISSTNQPYRDLGIPGKRPRLGKGTMNQELAEALEKRGLVSSVKANADGIRVNTFRTDE
jgi:hypothetical protein